MGVEMSSESESNGMPLYRIKKTKKKKKQKKIKNKLTIQLLDSQLYILADEFSSSSPSPNYHPGKNESYWKSLKPSYPKAGYNTLLTLIKNSKA